MWLSTCAVGYALMAPESRAPTGSLPAPWRYAARGQPVARGKHSRRGLSQPCPLCSVQHLLLHHIILHELVHLTDPEQALDNPWTDQQVKRLLSQDVAYTTDFLRRASLG